MAAGNCEEVQMVTWFGRGLCASALACAGVVTPWASPLPPDTAACGRTVAPAPSATVSIPIELDANHVVVKVCVAGERLDFVLDTGAAETFIHLANARRLGLSLGSRFAAGGVGPGTINAAVVNDAVLTIPGLPGTQRIRGALDLPTARAGGSKTPDGILGSDFLSTRVVAIDYAGSRLVVDDSATFRYDGHGSSLRLTFDNGHPHVDGAVRLADGEVIPGRFVIDVGSAAGLAFTRPFVEDHGLRDRVGPTLRRPAGVGVGGETMALFGRVAGLRLGTVELRDVIAGLHEDTGGAFGQRRFWVANIGGEILSRFTVYFDYSHARMILEPNRSFGAPFEIDMSGFGVAMNAAGEATVAFVLSGTPAADAGLERGDVIVAVDGANANGGTLRALRQRCRRPDERITFFIRRGAEPQTLTLVTRRLV
jgi:hypothetical protein